MVDHVVVIDGETFYPWVPASAVHNTSGGVYCFAKSSFSLFGVWYKPLYWGIAGHFGERLSQHDKWAPALHIGMDTVLIHYQSIESRREALERHLIQTYPTILNKQHNTAWGRAGALANALVPDQAAFAPVSRKAVDAYLPATGPRAVDAFLPPSRLPEKRGALANALMNPFLPVRSNTTATRRALARALDTGALYDEAWKPVR